MLDNCKNGCEFTDEIVAYMYDEISEPARSKFEQHLLDCTVCTDEFAGISNARFSVFEWRKEEFAHLPTPQIVIPYQEKSAGFFAGLRDLLTLSGWPAAATVAAGLIVSIGLGFAAMNYLGGAQEMASNKAASITIPPVRLPENNAQGLQVDAPIKDTETVVATTADDRQIRPVRAYAGTQRSKSTTVSQRPNNTVVRNPSAITAKAPALTNYDDADDKSLRLSDLFDDGGAE